MMGWAIKRRVKAKGGSLVLALTAVGVDLPPPQRVNGTKEFIYSVSKKICTWVIIKYVVEFIILIFLFISAEEKQDHDRLKKLEELKEQVITKINCLLNN